MKYYLVKENHYTDAFDGEAFRLFKATSRENVREQILEFFKWQEDEIEYPLQLLCGTDFVTFEEEHLLFENLEIEEISEQAFDILYSLFPESFERGYGLPTVLF